jgi:hypothetical protein
MRTAIGLVVLAALAACGSRVPPTEVRGDVAEVPPASARPPSAGRIGRSALIGELCPSTAGGRPGVTPWFVRLVGWLDQPADVSAPIARGSARQFGVLGFDGRRAGVFTSLGLATSDGVELAAGSYAGASPCALPAVAGQAAALDPQCEKLQRGCGVAIAEVSTDGRAPFDEDPEAVRFDAGAACVVRDDLVVDLDGDGHPERFPLAGFVDSAPGPAEEVVARDGEAPACDARFSLPQLMPARHPRGFLGLDLLAVVDADGDGRREILLQFRYAGRRTVALYATAGSTQRLERVGETVAR